MPSLRSLTAGVLLFACSTLATETLRPVLVVPLQSGPGVDDKVADLITETISADIQRATGRPIFTQKDVAALLGVERQRALIGCTETTSCLAEIAGALNAPLLLHGTVGRLGDTWVLNLNLIDAASSSVLRRYSSRSPAASAAVFLDESPAAVRQLFESSGDAVNGDRGKVHWLFVTLRGNVGLPPQDVASTTWFGSALAGVQITPAWSVALGGLVVRHGGAMARGAFTPFNALGIVKPVIAVEVPVLFGPSIAVGVALAPGLQVDATSWLSFGLDIPVTWFPSAPAGTPALYVFGAATATLRFL